MKYQGELICCEQQLLSVVSIHQHIKDALARHIPTHVSKHSLKSSLHDLHVIE